MTKKLKKSIPLVGIILVAFFFRLYGLNWDQGHHLHPDERFLTMVANAIKWPTSISEYLNTNQSPLNPHNVGHHFFVYGTFPLFLVKWIAESLEMGDYNRLTLVGRAASALFDVGTVVLVYLIVKQLFGFGRSPLHQLDCNHSQGNSNDNQGSRYLGSVENSPKIFSSHHKDLSNLYDSHKNNIPKSNDLVKRSRLLAKSFKKSNPGETKIKPNQAAERLPNTLDNTRAHDFLSFLFKRSLIPSTIPLLSAFFYAVSVLPIQLSHFFAVDTFLVFFLTLSFYSLLKITGGFDIYYLRFTLYTLLLSTAFGLAISSKITALLFLPIIVLGFFFAFIKSVLPLKARLWLFAFYFLFFTLATYFTVRLAYPYLFARPDLFTTQLNPKIIDNFRQLKSFDSPQANFPPAIQWIKTTAFLFPLKNMMFWGLGLPLAVLALGGFLVAIFQTVIWLHGIVVSWQKKQPGNNKTSKQSKQELLKPTPHFGIILIISWIAFLFFYQGAQFSKAMRYFAPIYPFLAIMAAYFAHQLLAVKKNHWLSGLFTGKHTNTGLLNLSNNQVLAHKKIFIIALLILIYPVSFLSIYSRPHTRVTASAWIYKNIPPGSTLATEHWDDGLPLPLPSFTSSLPTFTSVSLPLYDPDTPEKWEKIIPLLKRADYILLTSNRLYGSITSVPQRYPITNRYYRNLFNGSLGFEKIAEFTSRPNIPLPNIQFSIFNFQFKTPHICLTPPFFSYGLVAMPSQQCPLPGISFVDDYADETFTVYDHPKVIIFKKVRQLDYTRFL